MLVILSAVNPDRVHCMLNALAVRHPWRQQHAYAPAADPCVYQVVYVPKSPSASYSYTVFT